jgi:hypothetical protein
MMLKTQAGDAHIAKRERGRGRGRGRGRTRRGERGEVFNIGREGGREGV